MSDSAPSPFDPARFVSLPRVTDLAVSPDGARVVVSVQEPDDKGGRYVSSLWELDLSDGGAPRRLTRSEQGEASPVFAPDGSLLFVSSRPTPGGVEDEASVWRLPASGEPEPLLSTPGGVAGVAVASGSATVVVAASRLVGSADAAEDARRRQDRKDRRITATLHTGMPIRHWDHELGAESPRLLRTTLAGGDPVDLTPDAGFALVEPAFSISADGRRVATTWRRRERGGRAPYSVAVIDVDTGERRLVATDKDVEYGAPVISPDGRRVAVVREFDGDFDTPAEVSLVVVPVDGGEPVVADLGHLHPTEFAWAPDSAALFVAGDERGRAPVVAVDPRTGRITHRLADEAAYSTLRPAPDGRYVYALRSAVNEPPTPVRLGLTGQGEPAVVLARIPEAVTLPGSLGEVSVDLDGETVRGWLCLPEPGAHPAPLMVWIHGGPFTSWNGWSWRWNPWVAVARGYAVLLPDPALSTGYGPRWLARAWPHRAAAVWRDVEALTDEVRRRPDVDERRTACLGGSFGGYMTNWIAGHTERFDAIVTHAGLWALDQQHTTTDAAHWKSGLFGTPAEHPDWYAQNSPHHSVERITTPMLVIHGNRDYRVPVSEALRLWWDLVSRFDGDPDDLPHRFLQLTGENHWVLSPANAQIWYSTVLDFCDGHVGRA